MTVDCSKGTEAVCSDFKRNCETMIIPQTLHGVLSLSELVQLIQDRIDELFSRGENHMDISLARRQEVLTQCLVAAGAFVLREDPIVRQLLDQYAPNSDEYEKYAFVNPDKMYTRNLVSATANHDLMLICWNPNKMSPIHDHNGSNCHYKVLKVRRQQGKGVDILFDIQILNLRWQGEIREDLYEVREEQCRFLGSSTLKEGAVGYVNDRIGLHAIGE